MHIHLSYFDLFLIAAAAGGYYWYRVSKKNSLKNSTKYTYGNTNDDYYVKQTGESPWTSNHRTLNPVIRENESPWSITRNVQPAPVTATHYNTASAAPAPSAQTVVHEHYHGGSSGSDMLTGVLLGEMIAGGGHGGHDTTVVNNNTYVENGGVDHNSSAAMNSNYVDNGTWDSTPSTTSSDSSSGWDFSIGGSDSSDSSGGIDFSIGSDC